MGKKGGWFSAIKRAFTHGSKDKSSNVGSSDKRSSNKEKRKGKGILGHGETKSFIPLFREPSSIEKILGEAEQLRIRPLDVSPQQPNTPEAFLRRPAASPRLSSARIASPKAAQSQKDVRFVQRAELSLRNQHASATKIQAALRGYLSRRNLRALRGLVRLQGVIRGQNVKRQTTNAMKQMQLLVRVQTQIQSRRIQMMENRNKNDKDSGSNLNQLSGDGCDDAWDDSVLPREEIDARMRKKVEAIVKRERAMAYAYSHQLWKDNPKAAQIRSNRFPWWWNWLERQLPASSSSAAAAAANSQTQSIAVTPPNPNISDNKPSPQLSSRKMETPTRTPPQTVGFTKHGKPRGTAASNYSSYKDNDSLMSCPPFSSPSYMNPTVSAKAKARANSNPKERLAGTPGNESKRRFSFPLTPNIGPLKWNSKGAATRDVVAPQKAAEKHRSAHSIGDLSIDSTVSMPAVVGRKPFNRFV